MKRSNVAETHPSLITPILLVAAMGATRLFGLVRSVLLARLWGTGSEAAAFELCHAVTSTVYEITLGAWIATMVIPRFATLDQEKQRYFFSKYVPLAFLFTGILYLPLLLFPRASLALFTDGLSREVSRAARDTLRYLSFGRILLSASAVLTCILQTDKKPLTPALLYAAASFFSLPYVLVAGDTVTAESLALFMLITDLTVGICLFISVCRRHRPKRLPRNAYRVSLSPALFTNVLAVTLFSAYLSLVTLISTLAAADIQDGEAVAVNGYAIKWVLLSAALLSTAFHSVYYPRLATAKRVDKDAKRPLALLSLFSLIPTLVLFFFAKELVTLLYQSGSFSKEALANTVLMLRRYALSLPFLAAAPFLNDVAYLKKQEAALAKGALLSLACHLALLFLLTDSLGILAIPTAFLSGALLRTLVGIRLTFGKPMTLKKINLLIVHTDETLGGASRQLVNYLQAADTQRFAITVLLPPSSPLHQELTKAGFAVVSCGTEASFSLKYIFPYYRIIRKLRPHVFHANASLSARIAAFLAGVPVRLYTRHCVYPTPPRYRRKALRLAVRFSTSLLSHKVVAVAHKAAENLYELGIEKDRVTVIENGVAPITQNEELRRETRRALGYRDTDTVAVFCGRLVADKDVATMIRAVALLPKDARVHLMIVGKGGEEETLKRLAASLSCENRVRFCGFAEDVTPYLNAADLTVNCSVGTEATSLALAEAMSLSLPVIATDYGGNPAMVEAKNETDTGNGILIPKKKPQALADALLTLTDATLRSAMGKRSYEIYTQRYDATVMARRYEELYINLIERKGYTLI